MIWKQETSPGYQERFSDLYTMGAFPTMIFNGDYIFETGDTMEGIYDIMAQRNSSLIIDGVLESVGNNELRASASVSIVNDLNTEDNRIIFFVTRHDNDQYTHTLEIAKSDDLIFGISQAGEESNFDYTFSQEPSWQIEDIRVVVLVQSWVSKTILQASQLQFLDDNEADFDAEIRTGPACLEVRFQNKSLPVYGLDLVEWDFDSDGIIDSNQNHPVAIYDEPGSYSVTLNITKDGVTDTIIKEDYIIVTSSNEVSGKVSGFWDTVHSPYIINEDVTIPPDFSLNISEGTELVFSENAALLVKGKLIVEGTQTLPVIFTSHSSWNGIKIIDAADTCRISYAEISRSVQSGIVIDNSDLIISDCLITLNSADNSAPAMQLNNHAWGIIKRSFISQNHNSSYVGAIGIANSEAIMQNNLITNNSGNLASVIGLEDNSSAVMTNNTITNNEGGALAFIHTSSLSIMNSILRQNGNMFIQIASSPEVTYSCLSSAITGTGNITGEPLFSNPSMGSGIEYNSLPQDWILLSDSPCIDAGNPDVIYSDIENPSEPGFPLFPAQGSLTNDMGVYGGIGFDHQMNVVDLNEKMIPSANMISISPNPFNPATSISLQLQKPTRVCLDIFNTRGQKVTTIVNDMLDDGNHTFIWMGNNDKGKSVASGIYICRLVTDHCLQTKKMTLLK